MAKPKSDTTAKPATAAPAADDLARLTLPLTKGNTIDWDRLRPSRRDEVRKLLDASGVAAASLTKATAVESPLINAALVSTLYDLLTQVESLVAVRVLGCSMEQAMTALAFTTDEKKVLADPTVRVLNKWIPASALDKYADELLLALTLGTMIRMKAHALHTATTRRRPVRIDRLAQAQPDTEVNTETHKKSTENVDFP